MFTGIIEETGTVASIDTHGRHARITIRAAVVLGQPKPGQRRPEDRPTEIGDSICVNGICLTVTDLTPDSFSADVMPETMRRSSLGALRTGSPVNLERAMAMNGRFGGHIVSGHIDGTGTIRSIQRDENAVWFRIAAEDSLLRYIVEKGSIAIDGISLTVAEVSHVRGKGWFSVSVIPHTLSETSLSEKRAGSIVNLEADIIGKYVEQLLTLGTASLDISDKDSPAGSVRRPASLSGGPSKNGGRTQEDEEKDRRLRSLLAGM